MCISHSVGLHGINHSIDVKMVQVLVNENLGQLIPYAPVPVDGHARSQTIDMIGEFQRRVMKSAKPDSKVDPGGLTLRQLRAGMPAGLTANKLRGIMAYADEAKIARYYQALMTMMSNSQICTPLRIAHFLAQVGHESGDFRYSEEIASGSAYEGRVDLGNTQPGDGVRFKGRGLIQLTGRTNYTKYGAARNRDFVTPPNYLAIATNADLAVDVSCWFWTTHGLNAMADADNLHGITIKINGGTNGLPDRAAHLQRAKCFLLP